MGSEYSCANGTSRNEGYLPYHLLLLQDQEALAQIFSPFSYVSAQVLRPPPATVDRYHKPATTVLMVQEAPS